MITSNIGKIFLDAYNEEYGTNYDARTFFLEQFYPLFFDQNKYMMTAGNSPLENPKLSWDDMIKGKKTYETPEQRKCRFEKMIKKTDKSEADMSIARGYASLDIAAPTSGQVTDLKLPNSQEESYASWIGDALGVGVQGGFSILFSKKEILLDIFEGWKLYRKCLNETSMLKGNQINTWNGQWLSHYYDPREYDADMPLAGYSPYNTNKDGIINIDTQTWTKILIAVSKKYRNSQILGYIYSIGKTNKTIGFIPFDLTQIRRPIHLYEKIFGMSDGRNAESLWGTAIGFKTACTYGAIGIKAMEPKGLRDYVYKGKQPKAHNYDNINYNVYIIWIYAMLNNDELWEKSQELAKLLNEASSDKDKSISTKRKNLVETVLNATNKKQFIAAATEVVSFIDKKDEFKGIVKEIHGMPTDNVPYFLTLLRFQYKTL
ncbi:hypothetical protein [Segatella copri]|jgi:hypothetical protein|uniref:Uncharacterized protein n=1 Tax=Segatella copri TaxID=165179 RepID=A0AA92V0U5_9BACT|nr:hypothetical protein [Segatella copri]RHA86227.1 hypothetical protein DW916_08950 [Segatella copri]